MGQTAQTPSKYQEAIFDHVITGTGNGVVSAVAGAGKSWTLVEAAKRLPPGTKGAFVAFNNHIVNALKPKLAGTGMDAVTIHSFGRRALVANGIKLGEPDGRKYANIARSLIQRACPSLSREDLYSYGRGLGDLADKCRLTLTDPRTALVLDILSLEERFGIPFLPGFILNLLPDVLDIGAEQIKSGLHDFTDMIWGPLRLKLSVPAYEYVFADEIQDFNASQRDLILKMSSGRFLGVGDPKQSIMAFAGADPASFADMQASTRATVFALPVCYRCPTSHLDLARVYVPWIEAAPGAKTGVLTYASENKFTDFVKVGDLIVCRRTAPLISKCLELIAQGVPARVRGRDIGKMLSAIAETVSKMEGFDFRKLGGFLDRYVISQRTVLAEANASEEVIQSIEDRVAAIMACHRRYVDECDNSVANFKEKMEALFDDNNPGVWLSTIHRAKGLESRRVLLLQYDTLPLTREGQTDDQFQQELNLLYVALTRGIDELVLFGNPRTVHDDAPITTNVLPITPPRAITVEREPVPTVPVVKETVPVPTVPKFAIDPYGSMKRQAWNDWNGALRKKQWPNLTARPNAVREMPEPAIATGTPLTVSVTLPTPEGGGF